MKTGGEITEQNYQRDSIYSVGIFNFLRFQFEGDDRGKYYINAIFLKFRVVFLMINALF